MSSVRVSEIRRNEVVDALFVLSEGGSLPASREAALIARGPAFVRDARVAFVVIDCSRAPEALRDFARRAFRLEFVDADGELELYRPQ